MSAIAIATTTKVWIGGQDWSANLISYSSGHDELREGDGNIKARGTLVLGVLPVNPESMNPRVNRFRWMPGQSVDIQILNSSATYQNQTLGRMRIMEEPEPPTPSNPRLVIQVGCELSFRDYAEPDSDKSEVTLGTARACDAIATSLLQAANVPNISLGSWPYSLDYPLDKSGGGFVGQAGELAYCNHRIIYCNSLGQVVSKAIAIPTVPLLTITIGEDETLYQPLPDSTNPCELVRCYGVKRRLEEPENPRTDSQETYGTLGQIKPNVVSPTIPIVVGRTDTTDTITGSGPWTRTFLLRLYEPLGTIAPNSPFYASPVEVEQKQETYYYASDRRLTRKETLISQSLGKLLPEDYPGNPTLQLADNLQEDWLYDSNLVIRQYTLNRYERAGVALPDEDWPDKLAPIHTEQITETWEEISKGEWRHQRIHKRSQKLLNPEIETDNPALLVIDSKQSFSRISKNGDTQPPATEYLREDHTQIEEPLQGEARSLHAGGDTGRDRQRSYQVPYAVSRDQLTQIAKLHQGLLYGRRQGQSIGTPWRDEWFNYTPLSRVDCIEPDGSKQAYLIDGCSFDHTPTRAEVQFSGIWLGTVRDDGAIIPPYNEIRSLRSGLVIGGQLKHYVYPVEPVTQAVRGGLRIGGRVISDEPNADKIRGGLRIGGRVVSNGSLSRLRGGLVVGGRINSGSYTYLITRTGDRLITRDGKPLIER